MNNSKQQSTDKELSKDETKPYSEKTAEHVKGMSKSQAFHVIRNRLRKRLNGDTR